MKVCSVDGHETDDRLKRGMCSKHYQRQLHYGRVTSKRDLSLTERFWSNVRVGEPDGCWEWIGKSVHAFGYGDFRTYDNGKTVHHLAHRYVLELLNIDIDNKTVLHTCDNPPCVNPKHLQPGSQGDNVRDALNKGRMNLSGLVIGQKMSKKGIRHLKNRGKVEVQ